MLFNLRVHTIVHSACRLVRPLPIFHKFVKKVHIIVADQYVSSARSECSWKEKLMRSLNTSPNRPLGMSIPVLR
jgi:hypothetical protein